MTSFDGPSIGQRISHYRKLSGWTMEDLSERTFGTLKRDVIANIENGRKKDLTVEQLMQLAAALEVSPSALLFDIKKPSASAGILLGRAPGQGEVMSVWQAMQWLGGNPLWMTDSSPASRRESGNIWRKTEKAEYLRTRAIADSMEASAMELAKNSAKDSGKDWADGDETLLQRYVESSRRLLRDYQQSLEELRELGIEFNG